MLVSPPHIYFNRVELLSLDAGNTVIFLDHERLARELIDSGESANDISKQIVIRSEGEAKRLQETGNLIDVAWGKSHAPGGRSWGRFIGTLIHQAGVPMSRVGRVLEILWESHLELNLFSLVPPDLESALVRLRSSGVKVTLVSNSEGMLDSLFRKLGIRHHFDSLWDSGITGVEKPDARIFKFPLDEHGVHPDRALHLGDTFATDIVGARAAGIPCALIDPFSFYEGLFEDVPRVSSVADVVDVIVRERVK